MPIYFDGEADAMFAALMPLIQEALDDGRLKVDHTVYPPIERPPVWPPPSSYTSPDARCGASHHQI